MTTAEKSLKLGEYAQELPSGCSLNRHFQFNCSIILSECIIKIEAVSNSFCQTTNNIDWSLHCDRYQTPCNNLTKNGKRLLFSVRRWIESNLHMEACLWRSLSVLFIQWANPPITTVLLKGFDLYYFNLLWLKSLSILCFITHRLQCVYKNLIFQTLYQPQQKSRHTQQWPPQQQKPPQTWYLQLQKGPQHMQQLKQPNQPGPQHHHRHHLLHLHSMISRQACLPQHPQV